MFSLKNGKDGDFNSNCPSSSAVGMKKSSIKTENSEIELDEKK
jgi:hypothetical protein